MARKNATALLAPVFLMLCTVLMPNRSKAENVGGVEIVDRIVAVVNEDIISLFDLNQAIAPYRERIEASALSEDQKRENLFNLREEILDQLIDQMLTQQEIKRTKIKVSKEEIDGVVERAKKINYLTDEQLRAALGQEGLTMETYREKIEQQLQKRRLLNREVKSKIVLTKQDIKNYYRQHQNEYQGKKKYHLRNIIKEVPPLATDSEKQSAADSIQQIIDELAQGTSFEDLARAYSDSSLAAEGGDLGTFNFEDLSPQLQNVLNGLQEGQHTGVINSEQGYMIFYIEKLFTEAGKTLEEATPEIEEKLYDKIVDKQFKLWLSDLKKRSHIKIIR